MSNNARPFTPHNHRCPNCGLLWHHDPIAYPDPRNDQEKRQINDAYVQGHHCPTCGTAQFKIDDSNDNAVCLHNGLGEPKILDREPEYHDTEEDKLKRKKLSFIYFMDALQRGAAIRE